MFMCFYMSGCTTVRVFVCVCTKSTIDDVEALRKRHEDFSKALHGQDERMKALDDAADRLIGDSHPDSDLCVLSKR